MRGHINKSSVRCVGRAAAVLGLALGLTAGLSSASACAASCFQRGVLLRRLSWLGTIMALLGAVALTVSAPAGAAAHCTRFDRHLRVVAPGLLETRQSCLLRGSQQKRPSAPLAAFPRPDCHRFDDCDYGSTKVTALVGANCGGDKPYVQAGVNQTVPKFDARLQWPLLVAAAIARNTEPYKFGSRAVTSYTIVLSALRFEGEDQLEYEVRWSCTSNIDDAWHVFG